MSFRLFITVILILFITPQTSMEYYNGVVDTVHSTGWFGNYGEAKRFVYRVTWSLMFLYLAFNLLAAC
jgi:hypothetical protein